MSETNVVVDLGGTRLRVALADTSYRLSERREENTDVGNGPTGVIDQIIRMGGDALGARALTWHDVGCLVISSPGPLNAQTGVVYSPPNMPGWGTVPLKDEMEQCLGVATIVMNDANAAALGEFHFGACRGHRNMVYLTFSTGIGAGVVVDGKIMEGSAGTAGEVGHMTIDRHGPQCPCGNIGCLEVLASGTSIGRRFAAALTDGGTSIVTDWLGGRKPTGEDVTRAAEMGDDLARRVFMDAAEAIGTGVVNCIHIFNPEVIVIGGGVTKAGPLLFDTVQRMVDRHAMPVPRESARIVPAELVEDMGLMGAAVVACEPSRSTPASR